MPQYPFHCPKCDQEFDIVLTMADYSESGQWPCLHCENLVTKDDRIMCAANVTRASYVDGTKRPGFAENKEVMKLKMASYDMKPKDRIEIKKTIKEIERSGK